MAKRSPRVASTEAYIPNRHVFLSGIVMAVLTIGLLIYAGVSEEISIFHDARVDVLGEESAPTVTPYLTPTDTPQ